MKLGPLDLNQPSTWRGLLGFAGLIGLSLHPELSEQIAVTLSAVTYVLLSTWALWGVLRTKSHDR